jgi:hypothetical protein
VQKERRKNETTAKMTSEETVVATKTEEEKDVCTLLQKAKPLPRKRMGIRKLGKYMRGKHRKTAESEYFKWKSLSSDVYDKKDGKRNRIAGAIDFYDCKLLKTLDEEDPAMHQGKKVKMVRWIPSTMTFIFFTKPDPKSARIFCAEMTPLQKAT